MVGQREGSLPPDATFYSALQLASRAKGLPWDMSEGHGLPLARWTAALIRSLLIAGTSLEIFRASSMPR